MPNPKDLFNDFEPDDDIEELDLDSLNDLFTGSGVSEDNEDPEFLLEPAGTHDHSTVPQVFRYTQNDKREDPTPKEKIQSEPVANQIGFFPQGNKTLIIPNTDLADAKIVHKESGTAHTILTSETKSDRYSQQRGRLLDISEITETGVYEIMDRDQSLGVFTVQQDSYLQLLSRLGQSFYHWQCGIEKSPEIIGAWSHKVCHSQDCHAAVHPDTDEQGARDVSGGWHDAGDYNKYVCPTAVTIWWLLLTLTLRPDINTYDFGLADVYGKKQLLGLAKVGLDWLLTMQRDDGAFYHKVTEHHWSGHIPPDQDHQTRVIVPVSYEATAKATAVLYRASEVYKRAYPEDARRYKASSDKGYDVLIHSPDVFPTGFSNPVDVVTGPYADFWQDDNLFWAMTERYLTMISDEGNNGPGEEQNSFLQEIEQWLAKIPEAHYFEGHPDNWTCNVIFPAVSLLLRAPDLEVSRKIKERFLAYINKLFRQQQDSLFQMSVGDSLIWGSNGMIASAGVLFYIAALVTDDQKYYQGAWGHLHYLLGGNPLDFSFVTGFGQRTPRNPHYRPSTHRPDVPPGFLVGGANAGFDAGDFVLAPARQAAPDEPALHYTDAMRYGYASWASNEVAIYWNAPLLALVGCLTF